MTRTATSPKTVFAISSIHVKKMGQKTDVLLRLTNGYVCMWANKHEQHDFFQIVCRTFGLSAFFSRSRSHSLDQFYTHSLSLCLCMSVFGGIFKSIFPTTLKYNIYIYKLVWSSLGRISNFFSPDPFLYEVGHKNKLWKVSPWSHIGGKWPARSSKSLNSKMA